MLGSTIFQSLLPQQKSEWSKVHGSICREEDVVAHASPLANQLQSDVRSCLTEGIAISQESII